MTSERFDFLVIGSGLAGLSYARGRRAWQRVRGHEGRVVRVQHQPCPGRNRGGGGQEADSWRLHGNLTPSWRRRALRRERCATTSSRRAEKAIEWLRQSASSSMRTTTGSCSEWKAAIAAPHRSPSGPYRIRRGARLQAL